MTPSHQFCGPVAPTNTSDPQLPVTQKLFVLFCKTFTLTATLAGANHVLRGRWPSAIVAILAALANITLLTLYKQNKSITHLSRALLAIGAFLLTLNAFLLGGLESPSVIWFGFLPLSAGALLGQQWARRWTTYFAALTVVLFLWANNTQKVDNFAYFLSALVMILVTFFIFSSYDRVQKALRAIIEHKKNQADLLLKVLSQDLTPSLEIISSYLNTHPASPTKPDISHEEAKAALSAIREITTQARDWQTIEKQPSPEQVCPVEIHSLIHAIQCNFVVQLETHQIRFECADSNLGIMAAPLSLANQVFGNLMSNSIRFTPPGGRILFRAFKRGHSIHLILADTGVGMSRAQLEQLFSFAVPPPHAGIQGEIGRGFGLSIAACHVWAQGGSIRIRSKLMNKEDKRHGTVVRIVLPDARRQPQKLRSSLLIHLKVLVVDESQVFRRIANTALSDMGCIVRTASDYTSTLEAIKEEHFDAILIDAHLAEESDALLARKLRETTLGSNAKLFNFSSSRAKAPLSSAKLFDGYILKPLDLVQLRAVFNRIYEALPVADTVIFHHLERAGQTHGRPLLDSIINSYLSATPDTLKSLQEAAKAGALPPFRLASHKLRLHSENLGLWRLTRILEYAENIETLECITPQLLQGIGQEIEATLKFLRARPKISGIKQYWPNFENFSPQQCRYPFN